MPARPYAHYYKTNAWRRGRLAHLYEHPLCERCLKQGCVAAAEVVHHAVQHRGSWEVFIDPTNWESLCKPCHDQLEQSEEARGYDATVGVDGWPADARHPLYGAVPVPRRRFGVPAGARPCPAGVTLVTGSPGSGRMQVARDMAPDDALLGSVDLALERMGCTRWNCTPSQFLEAMQERDHQILRMSRLREPGRAYILETAPTRVERAEWRTALGPQCRTIVVLRPRPTCVARVRARGLGRTETRDLLAAVDHWFERHDGIEAGEELLTPARTGGLRG